MPPTPEELEALLRLLDDETPAVRERVAERLALCGGDISEWFATRPKRLTATEEGILAELLSPPRRETLEREWQVPSGGASALREDWDTFESILRQLSDFLHDGITLRQPLSDALDLLAEEAGENGVTTAVGLKDFLFTSNRFTANHHDYYDPKNSDLAWSIDQGKSNPLGLCLIFMLTARRLDLEVEGVNFPGHFMCRIFEDGVPLIVDCFDSGNVHSQPDLLAGPELSRAQRELLRQSASPGGILLRMLNNIHQCLEREERTEDAELVKELLATLQ